MERRAAAFERVRAAGLGLPGVEESRKRDGSPVLKVAGRFMTGMATHESAEANVLVVRASGEERECLIAEAPETYFTTSYYRRHAVVLVRLRRVGDGELRDLLAGSWRATRAGARKERSPAGL